MKIIRKILMFVIISAVFFITIITIISIGTYLEKINIVSIDNNTIKVIYHFGLGATSYVFADYMVHKLLLFYKLLEK